MSRYSTVSAFAPLVQKSDPQLTAQILAGLWKVSFDAAQGHWRCGENASMRFTDEGGTIEAHLDQTRIRLRLIDQAASAP